MSIFDGAIFDSAIFDTGDDVDVIEGSGPGPSGTATVVGPSGVASASPGPTGTATTPGAIGTGN